MAELAVVRTAVDAEVDVAAGRVGVILFDQSGDGLDDAWDFLGGPGVGVGRWMFRVSMAAKKSSMYRWTRTSSEIPSSWARWDYFVVNVCEVLDVLHLVADVLQVAAQDVEHHVAKGVADVGGRIRSNAADVHLDGIAVGGNKLFFPAGKRVVKSHASLTA